VRDEQHPPPEGDVTNAPCPGISRSRSIDRSFFPQQHGRAPLFAIQQHVHPIGTVAAAGIPGTFDETVLRTYRTRYGIENTEYRIQNTEYRIQNPHENCHVDESNRVTFTVTILPNGMYDVVHIPVPIPSYELLYDTYLVPVRHQGTVPGTQVHSIMMKPLL
jgi:hypothetical protein